MEGKRKTLSDNGCFLRSIVGFTNCMKEVDMSVGILFKIGAVGILVSLLCQLLKNSGRDDLGHLVSLAGLLIVLLWVLPYVLELFETMQRLFEL